MHTSDDDDDNSCSEIFEISLKYFAYKLKRIQPIADLKITT